MAYALDARRSHDSSSERPALTWVFIVTISSRESDAAGAGALTWRLRLCSRLFDAFTPRNDCPESPCHGHRMNNTARSGTKGRSRACAPMRERACVPDCTADWVDAHRSHLIEQERIFVPPSTDTGVFVGEQRLSSLGRASTRESAGRSWIEAALSDGAHTKALRPAPR